MIKILIVVLLFIGHRTVGPTIQRKAVGNNRLLLLNYSEGENNFRNKQKWFNLKEEVTKDISIHHQRVFATGGDVNKARAADKQLKILPSLQSALPALTAAVFFQAWQMCGECDGEKGLRALRASGHAPCKVKLFIYF